MSTAKEQPNAQHEDLLAFKWDKDSEDNFFGIETETVEPEKLKTKEKEKVKTETVKGQEDGSDDDAGTEEKVKTEKKTKEEDDEPFKAVEETVKSEEDQNLSDTEFFTNLTKEFKTKKLFRTLELKDDEEVDEEKFFELAEEEAENRAEEIVEAFMDELDEDGKAFLKFKKDGGQNSEFFKVYAQSAAIPQVDVNTTEGQDAILRYYYKNHDDMDDAEINDKLEWLAENGKKADYAVKYNTKIQTEDKKKKEQLLITQQKAQEKAIKSREKFINSVKNVVTKSDDINGFKFVTKKDKTEVLDFITKPSIELENGRTLTGLQNAFNELFKEDNHDKLVILAKILKNNFDFSDVVSKVKTEVTKEAKSTLNKQRETSRPASQPNHKKSLAEFF